MARLFLIIFVAVVYIYRSSLHDSINWFWSLEHEDEKAGDKEEN